MFLHRSIHLNTSRPFVPSPINLSQHILTIVPSSINRSQYISTIRSVIDQPTTQSHVSWFVIVWFLLNKTFLDFNSELFFYFQIPLNYLIFFFFFAGKNGRVPDFVFLAHIVDMSSAMHAPFIFRSFASTPFCTRLFLIPFLPIVFVTMFVMWAYSKVFLATFYNLRGRLHQTWVVPRFGFQVC